MDIDPDIRAIIEPELMPGETLLWADKPQKLMLMPFEKFFVIFICFWIIVCVFLLLPNFLFEQSSYEITKNGIPTEVTKREYLATITVFPFVAVFFLSILSAFILFRLKLIYAITSKRGIIVSPSLFRKVTSIFPTQLCFVERTGQKEFGNLSFHVEKDFTLPFYIGGGPYQFSGIKTPKTVESLILSTFLKEEPPHE